MTNRRQFLTTVAATAMVPPLARARSSVTVQPIGVCDWTLKKATDPAALAFARKIGCDGVQVDFGREVDDKGNLPLFSAKLHEEYAEAVEQSGTAICSLAMGVLNKIPLKSDPMAAEWLTKSLDVAKAMKQKIVLLAFFGNGDLQGDEAGKKAVIDHLKKLAPHAEEAGVTYGIESWLKIDELEPLLDAVDSPNVNCYYDVGNLAKVGADIFKEIRSLGKERICQVHAKDYGGVFGEGNIDFPKVRDTLAEIKYDGWIVMEGTKTKGSVEESNRNDCAYLKKVWNRRA